MIKIFIDLQNKISTIANQTNHYMKQSLKISVIILFTFLLFSCNRKQNISKEYCNLTINCDNTFRYDLFSNVILTNATDTLNFKMRNHNDSLNTTCFQWDSIKSGEYNLHIQSIFSHEQKEKITLTQDTTLTISNCFVYKKLNLIPIHVLVSADTIEFAYRSTGCSFHFEKYMLVKNNFVYKLTGTYTKNGSPIKINKTVSPLIVKKLFALQKKSKKYVKEALKNDKGGSTMRHEFYLLAKNKLFLCDDMNTSCPVYNEFKAQFITSE